MPEVEIPLNLSASTTGLSSGLASILVIDDEAAIRESLEVLLTLEGYSVRMAADGIEGLRTLDLENFDLLLLDLNLPGESGLELLPQIKERHPELPVIMITAYGTVDNVVEAIRAGAENFVQKPWDNEKLLADIRSAVARHRAEEEVLQLKRTLKQRYNFSNIVGKSEIMLKVFDLVAQVAPSRSTVLIQGESGTGKEMIAKAIHANSPRRDKPFVPINTGAMPSELLESTLFGHVKGAFTSAIASKKGLFEVANGGTLFLDEIATMGMDTQAKILRVLQDRRFMHLGGISEIQVDVRIIAATNIDLRQAVRDGRFREDLFYRLNVICVDLPPPGGYSPAGQPLSRVLCQRKWPRSAQALSRRAARPDRLRVAGECARAGKFDRTRRRAFERAGDRLGSAARPHHRPQLPGRHVAAQPQRLALRHSRRHRAAHHYREAGALKLESDRSSRAIPHSPLHAQPEDQAPQYRDSQKGQRVEQPSHLAAISVTRVVPLVEVDAKSA
jgi:FixJ family two-component response regulator